MKVKRSRAVVPYLCLSLALAAIPRGAPTQEAEATPLTRRKAEILQGIVKYAPWEPPERWLHELGSASERSGILRERMTETVSWIEFLSFANLLDWSDGERRVTLDFLLRRLSGTRSGKARQNIVFLAALTDPDARTTIGGLLEAGSASLGDEDRLDARSALAALGDERSIAWFVDESPPTRAFVGRPVFEFADYEKEEKDEGSRAAVRSYRFWEVLFREPYFKRLKLLARAGIYSMNARGTSAPEREAIAARLLPAFIEKWPGHPGSDDFALRLMNHAIGRRDLKEIYIWAQRASLLPDQDSSGPAVAILKALAESQLTTAALDEVLASGDGKQNRDFLLYERFLKTARQDLAAGIEAFDRAAATDRGGVFALARRDAARVEPSKALRDGIRGDIALEILRLYPERSRRLAETPHEPRREPGEEDFLGVLENREREVVRRTSLDRTRSVTLDPGRLARQYRLLVELRNLESVERDEADPERKADLRYRQAKMFYREEDILFPIWTGHTLGWGYSLNAVRYDGEGDRRLEEYSAQSFALRRAYGILESILRDYPAYRGRHNVAYHMAQAYAKLMDYRPAKAVDAWVLPDRPAAGSREGAEEYGHRRVGELFRKVANEFPESEWADESERGAAYRLKMAGILRAKREKEERARAPAGEPRGF
jgi:hypothetical protein